MISDHNIEQKIFTFLLSSQAQSTFVSSSHRKCWGVRHLSCTCPGPLIWDCAWTTLNRVTNRHFRNGFRLDIKWLFQVSRSYRLAKADRRPLEKKKFYHQFSIVKYSYLPTDTFRKYVEMHVTRSKLTLKFTGYCRQTSYTDSTVIHTLLPAVAWVLKSQFPLGYMHFNIFSEGVCGKIWIFDNGK